MSLLQRGGNYRESVIFHRRNSPIVLCDIFDHLGISREKTPDSSGPDETLVRIKSYNPLESSVVLLQPCFLFARDILVTKSDFHSRSKRIRNLAESVSERKKRSQFRSQREFVSGTNDNFDQDVNDGRSRTFVA